MKKKAPILICGEEKFEILSVSVIPGIRHFVPENVNPVKFLG